MQHTESACRVVDTAFVERSRGDGIDIALFLHIIDMPVAVDPGFQVMFIQIDLFPVVDTEYELVAVSQQVMVEDNDRFSLRNLCQIVL